MARRINRAGLAIIKKWEGWRSTAYRDAIGVWTIGYGHTSAAGHPEVRQGMKISRAEGERILLRDVSKFERAVERALDGANVTDNQFSAMVSLCFNIGPDNFRRSSLLAAVKRGNMRDAANRFKLYRTAGGKVLQGLVKRRADEAALFRSSGGGGAAGSILVGAGGAAAAAQKGLPAEVVVIIVLMAIAMAGFIIWRKTRKR